MKKTSAKVENYLNQVQSGNLKNSMSKILESVVEMKANTIHDLRINLKMKHQTLTGALNVLMDLGLVKVNGKTTIGKHSYSILVFVQDPINQKAVAEKRLMKKYEDWKKKGMSEFVDLLPECVRIELENK